MNDFEFKQIIKLFASAGASLQLLQFVRMVRPSEAIERVVLRVLGIGAGDSLEAVYGDGIPLNEIAGLAEAGWE